MALRPILHLPDSRLNQKSAEIHQNKEWLKSLFSDLVDTMNHYPGCVGLAAPQIGRFDRAFVVDTRRYRKKVCSQGLIMIINPVLINFEGEVQIREGCLSVPEFTGNVTRAERISIEGLNPDGEKIKIEASHFESIVIQHELDHLDGLLFLDQISSLKTDIFRRKTYLH